jgi:hypothetical protein
MSRKSNHDLIFSPALDAKRNSTVHTYSVNLFWTISDMMFILVPVIRESLLQLKSIILASLAELKPGSFSLQLRVTFDSILNIINEEGLLNAISQRVLTFRTQSYQINSQMKAEQIPVISLRAGAI